MTSPLFPSPKKKPFNPLDPTQPIDTPYRVGKVLELAQTGAFLIAAFNLLWTFVGYVDNQPPRVWLFTLITALIAVLLGLVIRRSAPAWACWVLLVWGALEFLRGVLAFFSGEGAYLVASAGILYCSAQGIRAVRARQRLATAEASAEAEA